ncbi:MAG: hypothetical protein LBE34_11445 [Flavobacteriaceae bacterium]|jgi:hypothetical protein|nr:hypothetical protein [Flavobacteriaceae bacterium]
MKKDSNSIGEQLDLFEDVKIIAGSSSKTTKVSEDEIFPYKSSSKIISMKVVIEEMESKIYQDNIDYVLNNIKRF